MFQDFEFKLRNDSKFRDKIANSVSRIHKTYQDSLNNPSLTKFHKEAVQDYLHVSNFNLSPLLGFYFPNYPSSPYSLKDFPFAHCYYQLNIGPSAYSVYRGSRQIGKCVDYNSVCNFRNKNTGEVISMKIGEFFKLI